MTEPAYHEGHHPMADGEDDDRIPAAPLSLMVGDLRGRMSAHERRMDRHEAWVGEKFTSLDGKIDGVDAKVDRVIELLAGQAGGRAILKFFMQPAVVILGAICSIAGAILLHLLRVN